MAVATVTRKSLQEDVRKLFERAKLPSSPAVASRILKLAENPDATGEDFAKIIQADGALSARILRMANAADLALTSRVSTVRRAVTVLGMERVRTAALGFQLISHVDRLGKCPFDMRRYWQLSLLRGCLTQSLAEHVVPELKEEAFLVGLLQDCGIPILVQILETPYAEFFRDNSLATGAMDPTAFFAAEKEKFPHNHVDASAAIAAEWQLPPEIAVPIGRHHQPMDLETGSSPVDKLCGVAYLVASVGFSKDLELNPLDAPLQDYAQSKLKITAEMLQAAFVEAKKGYAEMAESLGDMLPEETDVGELLSEANRQLLQAAGQADIRAAKAHANQSQLRTALGQYRERAARDPLTGILNRGALLDCAAQLIEEWGGTADGVTVFFLDIDNFKRLNDDFGHATGDAVLQLVGNTLIRSLGKKGVAGRYGGEEFVVVILGLTEGESRREAEELVQHIRGMNHRRLNIPSPITCSLGAIWAPANNCRNIEPLIAAADKLMYASKKSGKDRATFQALKRNDKVAHAASPGTPTPELHPQNPHEVPTTDFKPICREGLPLVIPERIRKLVSQLNQKMIETPNEARKFNRVGTLATCKLTRYLDGQLDVVSEDAYVRNISAGGLSILTTTPLRNGEPLEIAVQTQGKPLLYFGGLVTFCRQIDEEIHELGIRFAAHGKTPLFSTNPAEAPAQLPWLAEALNELKNLPPPGTEIAAS